jgi:hypothetical protein
MEAILPNFIIIGAPRSGTTWMHENLREHPDVFMPREKELHFFDRHYEEGTDYYRPYFNNVNAEKAIGEATPAYMYKPEVCRRIKDQLPQAKLIVSLRNPIDRIYSRYWNALGKYAENEGLSFEQKISKKTQFVSEGFYYDHLTRFYDEFPEDQLLVLLFDDLKSDPNGFLTRICEFLDVSPDFSAPWSSAKINAAEAKPRLAKSRSLYYAARVARRAGFRDLSVRIDAANQAERPPMRQETRRWLIEEVYGEQIEKLASLINRDLSSWTT